MANHGSILFVDDDPFICRAYGRMLETEGYDVAVWIGRF